MSTRVPLKKLTENQQLGEKPSKLLGPQSRPLRLEEGLPPIKDAVKGLDRVRGKLLDRTQHVHTQSCEQVVQISAQARKVGIHLVGVLVFQRPFAQLQHWAVNAGAYFAVGVYGHQ
jgi:hypothetical protein